MTVFYKSPSSIDIKTINNKHDYKWKAVPNDICGKPSKPNGTWCPKCARESSAALMKIKTKSYIRDQRGKFVSKQNSSLNGS